jgi:predicted phage terminase large subunit-like protein
MLHPRILAHRSYENYLSHAKSPKDHLEIMAELGRKDLFFLLVYLLGRKDADQNWIFERCREVQAGWDGVIHLWSRFHYKSTIISYALPIFLIINNPDELIALISYKVKFANELLDQIKRTLESNELLKQVYPDVLYQDPEKESPRWTVDNGFIVKRKSSAKEPTITAFGLVGSQQTGGHWTTRIYDDACTQDSVATDDALIKNISRWELSLNLNAGNQGMRETYAGTRYSYADLYSKMMERGYKSSVRLATVDGTLDGDPVLLPKEELVKLYQRMGSSTFLCQIMQNPLGEGHSTFNEKWLRYWPKTRFNNMNFYITCDPAGSKTKKSDYTVFWVIGVGADKNFYVIDAVRDRMNLTQRWNTLAALWQKWEPKAVGYEKYGLMSDIEHFHYMMNESNLRFHITEVGGSQSKENRIKRLEPICEDGRLWLPEGGIHRTDYQGNRIDVIQEFIKKEYTTFPLCEHDDMLDALSRIIDLNPIFPQGEDYNTRMNMDFEENEYDPRTY